MGDGLLVLRPRQTKGQTVVYILRPT
jgi:hypothetical protein